VILLDQKQRQDIGLVRHGDMGAGSKFIQRKVEDFLKSFNKKTYYHGTKSDIKEFDERSFFTDDPEEASMYSTGEAFARDADLKGARVYPVKIKTDNIFDVENKEHQELINEIANEMGYPNVSDDIETSIFGIGSADLEAPDELQNLLEMAGFDGVKERFPSDTGGVIENIVLFNPAGKVRSVNAKFDPSKSSSGDILASIGGGSVALGALSGLEEGT
jgi:hypothetical protein